jgi:uncharacterized Zn-binding protein involved in type VI secretion
MPGSFLNTAAVLICPHGGQVVLSTSTTRVTVLGLPVVRAGDQHQINGCPFSVGGVPEPCLRVIWGSGSGIGLRVTIQGQPAVLAEPGAGTCFDVKGQPKGSPTIGSSQARVRGI